MVHFFYRKTCYSHKSATVASGEARRAGGVRRYCQIKANYQKAVLSLACDMRLHGDLPTHHC